MAPIDKAAIETLLTNGEHRSLIGGKQLTLAFGGLYIASTTLSAKPLLVWETDSGYPRYYVPVEALHNGIKAKLDGSEDALTNGQANGRGDATISLEKVDSVKAKGSNSEAVIERLTVNSKATSWVRFVEGPKKDFVRFEKDEIDDWFENGGLFMGIKNPFKRIDTKPVSRHVVVKVDGGLVAESEVAVLLNETGLKDAYYIPATSIKDWGMAEKSSWRTACPYKGEAWYLNLTVNGKKYENVVWYYPYPTHESAGIEGFVSFYNREGVDILIDDVKV